MYKDLAIKKFLHALYQLHVGVVIPKEAMVSSEVGAVASKVGVVCMSSQDFSPQVDYEPLLSLSE